MNAETYTLPSEFGNNLEYTKYALYQSSNGVTLHLSSKQALRKLSALLGTQLQSVYSQDGKRELSGKDLVLNGKTVGMAFPERNGEFAVTLFNDFLGQYS